MPPGALRGLREREKAAIAPLTYKPPMTATRAGWEPARAPRDAKDAAAGAHPSHQLRIRNEAFQQPHFLVARQGVASR